MTLLRATALPGGRALPHPALLPSAPQRDGGPGGSCPLLGSPVPSPLHLLTLSP